MNIVYKDKIVGQIKNGKIYSKDPDLNAVLSFVQKKGWLQLKKEKGLDRLQYSKDPKEFWEFLQKSGFTVVAK